MTVFSRKARGVLSSINAKYHAYNSLAWFMIFSAQLLAIILLSKSLASSLLGDGQTYGEFHNEYCRENAGANVDQIVLNGTVDGKCAYDYNFKKVLYFWCDGISWDTAGPVFDVFPDHSNFLKVRHNFNPWSAWVFTTFMTGKASRNMGEFSNDNLIYQFWLSGKKAYLGAERSTSYVLSQAVLDFATDNNVSYYNKVRGDNSRMFQWFFECSNSGDTERCVREVLEDVKRNDRSMFFESFLLDHRAHEEESKYGPIVLSLRDKFAEDLSYVKAWVDANPEYLLVVVSDHGQKESIKDADIHGKYLENGNEGWMLVYNPEIEASASRYNPPVLRTVDVAPTLWQFFSASGVSIPAENVGKIYPLMSSAQNKYNALKTNAIQLRRYLKELKPFKSNDESWNMALSEYDDGMLDQAVGDMDAYVKDLSAKFLAETGRIPYKLPLFAALVSLAGTTILQFGSFEVLWAAARTVGYGVLASPYLLWIVITVFFAQSSDFVPRNQVYTYVIPVCMYLASYIVKRVSKVQAIFAETKTDGHVLLRSIELRSSRSSPTLEDEEEAVTIDSDVIQKSESDFELPVVEEKKFLYFEIWDKARKKEFLGALSSFFKYIFGVKAMPKSSLGFWLMNALIMYAIFSCFEIAFSHKRFIWSDIHELWMHSPFWTSLSYAVLFLEFRWQRILLNTNLKLAPWKYATILQQIFHPSFWPLNIKTVLYFYMMSVSFFPSMDQAFFIYAVCFVHLGLLLFSPTYIQRDLFLPLFVLLSLVSPAQEKILLCFYAIVMLFFSNALEKPSPSHRHAVLLVVVGMVSLSHYYFSVLFKNQYFLDQITIAVPGISDVTYYPKFSVAIMALHYLGVFLMVVPFLVRLNCPAPPPLKPFKLGRITFGHIPIGNPTLPESLYVHTKRQTMTFLVFCSAISVLLYFLNSLSQQTDTPLLWAFMICAITLGYGATIIAHEIFHTICIVLKFICFTVAKLFRPKV